MADIQSATGEIIGEGKKKKKIERLVAMPNVGGALYSTPQSLADAHYYMPCSNAAKTRNQC